MPGSTANADLATPLKLLMTADAVGGVWRYCIDLATVLASHGAEIMVATMGPRPNDIQRAELLSIPHVRVFESDYALEWMPNPWSDIDASGKWLLDLQSSFDADLVHLNGYTHASLPWSKPVMVAAHSCVYSWWRAIHGCAPGPEWAEYRRRVAAGISASDAIIAPSAYMAREIANEYGVSSDKIQVIHNFTRTQARQSSNKQAFLLAAGRIWDAAKNLDLLDRIAPQLDWEVRLAGDNRGLKNSPSQPRRATFLGPLPHTELMHQMDRASIFAHPALYEPFGLSVLEAARARCCLVLSDIPSLRELWDGAAIFVDPRQPEVWISALNQLARNDEDRERLAQLAHSHSMKYEPTSSIQQYCDTYESLISSNAGVAA